MRKLALFTTLVLTASAGSALASPWDWSRQWSHDHDDYDDTSDEGPVTHQHWAHDARGRWVPLARHKSAFTNHQIVLQGEGGPMRRISIQADRGAPVVTRVTVEFIGGQTPQITNVNRRLPSGTNEVISLNRNRGVKRIIVYTEPRFGGAYSVFGT